MRQTDNPYKIYEPLFGSWYIDEQIGRGGEGQLFRICKEDEFGERFRSVLKAVTIPGDEAARKSILARGIREEDLNAYYEDTVSRNVKEYRLMYRLKGNSHIVSYEDHQVIRHQDDPGWDILMRMEELTPLTDYVLSSPMSPDAVMKMGADICRGLSFCARCEIIHRDIKPENIFISESGDFKLGDFGIAQILEYTQTAWSRKGTYTYMAPEVYRGEGYGASVDIYSLGLVMYKYLNNGRDPFLPAYPAMFTTDDEELALAKRISGKPLPPPSEGPEDLKNIILKACSYDPGERFGSADEMLRAIESVKSGKGWRPARSVKKRGNRTRRKAAAAVIALCVAAAGIGWAAIPKEVTAIEGIGETQTMYLGDELAPEYSVEPSRFSDEKITFSSGDESVFTVDEDGRIQAVAPGTAEMTMEARGFTRTVSVTVEAKVTSIDNIPESLAMETGDTEKLEPALSPRKFADEKVSYSSEDPSVAKVTKKGKITAEGAGKVRITVSAGGCSKTITVTVTDPVYDSGSSSGSSGSGSSDSSSGSSGSSSGSSDTSSGDEGYFDSSDDEYY